MVTFISRSPEDTRAFGESLGKSAQVGTVIGVTGDLGAGKTELVKGLARALGIKVPVHSPTFALVHEYAGGRFPLFHIDLYRLESPSQILGAGLEEYFYNPPGVTVIEWVERWGQPSSPVSDNTGLIAPAYRQVTIEIEGETERRITYDDSSA